MHLESVLIFLCSFIFKVKKEELLNNSRQVSDQVDNKNMSLYPYSDCNFIAPRQFWTKNAPAEAVTRAVSDEKYLESQLPRSSNTIPITIEASKISSTEI